MAYTLIREVSAGSGIITRVEHDWNYKHVFTEISLQVTYDLGTSGNFHIEFGRYEAGVWTSLHTYTQYSTYRRTTTTVVISQSRNATHLQSINDIMANQGGFTHLRFRGFQGLSDISYKYPNQGVSSSASYFLPGDSPPLREFFIWENGVEVGPLFFEGEAFFSEPQGYSVLPIAAEGTYNATTQTVEPFE